MFTNLIVKAVVYTQTFANWVFEEPKEPVMDMFDEQSSK